MDGTGITAIIFCVFSIPVSPTNHLSVRVFQPLCPLHQIINLQCEKTNKVFQFLQKHELIKDITIYGDALHLAVDSAEEAMPVLNQFLKEHAVTLNEMNAISPSIEDVFVALSKKTKETV